MRVLIALLLVALSSSYAAKHMKVVYSWHEVDYTFYDDETKSFMTEDGRFTAGNSVPIGFDVDTERDRVFISMPRLKPGNPAALATISTDLDSRGDYKLMPYPSWRWHRQGDCEGITSVHRVSIDECDRLWVVDTGTVGDGIGASVETKRICPAQLLIFDLEHDQMIQRYEIPEKQIKQSTVLTNIAVNVIDKNNKCANTYAYIADSSAFGLLVFDLQKEEFWRVESNAMFPYPPMGEFNISGKEFDLMEGVLGLALTPKVPGKDRYLYFHSLASDRESWVSTTILHTKANFGSSGNFVSRQFHKSPEARGQSAGEAFDENGVLFFSDLPKLSLNCWNSQSEYKKENLLQIDQDTEQFQFASGVKVKKNRQGVSEVWMLSSRFQMHMTGDVSSNEVNYRLMKASVDDLLHGHNYCKVTKMPTQVSAGRVKEGGGKNSGSRRGVNSGNRGRNPSNTANSDSQTDNNREAVSGTSSVRGGSSQTSHIESSQYDNNRVSGNQQGLTGGSGNQYDNTGVSGNRHGSTGVSGNHQDLTGVSGNRHGSTGVSGNHQDLTGVSGNRHGSTGVSGNLQDNTGVSGKQQSLTGGSGNQYDNTRVSGNLQDNTGVSGNQYDNSRVSGNQQGLTGGSGNQYFNTGISGNRQDNTEVSGNQHGSTGGSDNRHGLTGGGNNQQDLTGGSGYRHGLTGGGSNQQDLTGGSGYRHGLTGGSGIYTSNDGNIFSRSDSRSTIVGIQSALPRSSGSDRIYFLNAAGDGFQSESPGGPSVNYRTVYKQSHFYNWNTQESYRTGEHNYGK